MVSGESDLIYVTFAHLEYPEVVVSFGVIIVGSQRETQTLVCQSAVANSLQRQTVL